MGPLTPAVLKDKDRDKTLDRSGVTLEATIPDPTIRTGVDQEITHPLDHVFLLKMIMLWILLPLSAKLQMTKNAKNTKRWVDASNVESKVTSSMIVPIKRHALIQLVPFKSKTMTNQLFPKPLPHLCHLLCK